MVWLASKVSKRWYLVVMVSGGWYAGEVGKCLYV